MENACSGYNVCSGNYESLMIEEINKIFPPNSPLFKKVHFNYILDEGVATTTYGSVDEAWRIIDLINPKVRKMIKHN